ncbi:hypothetical protein [Dendrosporobacter sp. 1207_IL3150]|uniref:hypothetical protein n=1 Tax=Dendrosporobacter sp. 1207_IL3150 TaxID=3084054 RepID=UPI002FDA8010
MSVIVASQLKAGVIFGDNDTQEYVYMPGGEIGVDNPICVLETAADRQDIEIDLAVSMVLRLHLRPIRHPRLGTKSC